MRRTQAQWQSLIEEQQQSGQTATAFCKDRGVNPKYFSLRKTRLQDTPPAENKTTGFVRIAAPAQPQGIHLSCGAVKLSIPSLYPVGELAELFYCRD